MTVPAKPLLKPWFRRATTAEGVLLEHGRSTVAFGGAAATRLLPTLLPLLDGRRTIDEIVAAVGAPARAAVENALELMTTHGLLTDGPPVAAELPAGLLRTAAYLGQGAPVAPHEIASRLASSTVLLEGDEELVGIVGSLLRRCGVRRAREGAEATFVGTAAERAGDPLFERRNELALDSGEPWLPFGCFDGRCAIVGPLVVPRETACYRCFALRRESTASCRAELASLRSTPVRAPMAAPLVAFVAALAAERIVLYLGVGDPALPGTVLTVETLPELTIASDRLLRVPRCPACSGLAGSGPPVPWHEGRWEQT